MDQRTDTFKEKEQEPELKVSDEVLSAPQDGANAPQELANAPQELANAPQATTQSKDSTTPAPKATVRKGKVPGKVIEGGGKDATVGAKLGACFYDFMIFGTIGGLIAAWSRMIWVNGIAPEIGGAGTGGRIDDDANVYFFICGLICCGLGQSLRAWMIPIAIIFLRMFLSPCIYPSAWTGLGEGGSPPFNFDHFPMVDAIGCTVSAILLLVLMFVLDWLNNVVFEAFGGSLGNRLSGLRVATEDNKQVPYTLAWTRFLKAWKCSFSWSALTWPYKKKLPDIETEPKAKLISTAGSKRGSLKQKSLYAVCAGLGLLCIIFSTNILFQKQIELGTSETVARTMAAVTGSSSATFFESKLELAEAHARGGDLNKAIAIYNELYKETKSGEKADEKRHYKVLKELIKFHLDMGWFNYTTAVQTFRELIPLAKKLAPDERPELLERAATNALTADAYADGVRYFRELYEQDMVELEKFMKEEHLDDETGPATPNAKSAGGAQGEGIEGETEGEGSSDAKWDLERKKERMKEAVQPLTRHAIGLAACLTGVGQYEESNEILAYALGTAHRMGDYDSEQEMFMHTAINYARLKKDAESDKWYQRSLDFAMKREMRNYFSTKLAAELAHIYVERKQLEHAAMILIDANKTCSYEIGTHIDSYDECLAVAKKLIEKKSYRLAILILEHLDTDEGRSLLAKTKELNLTR